MKFYIELPRIYDYNEKNDVHPFFDEICAIAIDMYIESTTKEGGIVDHMNVVDVPPAQVDQFELICEKYKIQFKAA
ncbi:MAG: hypothetical protein KAQ89_00230 [Planctomycetes bacterium]|nr:hypothetical protein [Planctomycetota bacterium]